MFTYLHAYHTPETWDAQVKAGLVKENHGIRYCQSIDIDEELKFNNLARRDGHLHRLLQEHPMPFYIDRLQGGCFLEQYPYDMDLVEEYKTMLGEKFWGFQMHEWMSNYKSDLEKLERSGCAAWNADTITAAIRAAFPFEHVFVEAMSPEEYEKTGKPGTYEEFLENARWLFKDRQDYTDGMLLPCDSGFLAYAMELKNGARRLMPEIGAQTANTRIQVAYARGMAKAYGVPFGTYYEPWGGDPFSSCCYNKEGRNEWNIGPETFPFETNGENGGSSRSMQRRMHLYSYFAGVSFIAEEWGLCNTFYDWNNFELSPYGRVKKEFIELTEKYPEIGTPVTPIAVVLPKELEVLDQNAADPDRLLRFPVEDALKEKLLRVRAGLKKLFCETEPMLGSETRSLLNCTVPDALDIVHEDKFDAAAYEYLVDLTGGSALARSYGKKLCAVEDVPALLTKLLPCGCTGGAMKQFTRRADGSYCLLLTNNSGVQQSVAGGEVLLPEAASVVRVEPKAGLALQPAEGNGTLHRNDDGSYTVELPAGGWFFGLLG